MKNGEDAPKKLLSLANKALKTINTKRYGYTYLMSEKNTAKIGLGVYGRGRALALFKGAP
jgi:hypothetical protein